MEKIEEQSTDKEKQILKMRVQGKLIREIADNLNCSSTTVNLRIKKIKDEAQKIKDKYIEVKNGEGNFKEGEHLGQKKG